MSLWYRFFESYEVQVFLSCEPEGQYSPLLWIVPIGNQIMAGEICKNKTVEGKSCADSNLTLKEQMEKLDNMELVNGNKSSSLTDDDKSIAY
jgi:hypothetical protein